MLSLSGAAVRLGAHVLSVWGRSPHGTQLTLGRALLALSTLIVLLFNHSNTLLHNPQGAPRPTVCEGMNGLGAFCAFSSIDAEILRGGLILLCLPALLGLLPAISAPLYAYSAHTVSANTAGVEGGDQLAATFGFLFTLICITDWRLNGWRPRRNGHRLLRHIPANVLLALGVVQITYVYLEAAVVKQAHPIWSEGSALWYWAQQTGFGARPEVQEIMTGLLQFPVVTHALTWGVIVFEYALAFSVIAARRRNARLAVLSMSVFLHVVFALVLGLITFGITMLGIVLAIMWRSKDALPWWMFRRFGGLAGQQKRVTAESEVT